MYSSLDLTIWISQVRTLYYLWLLQGIHKKDSQKKTQAVLMDQFGVDPSEGILDDEESQDVYSSHSDTESDSLEDLLDAGM